MYIEMTMPPMTIAEEADHDRLEQRQQVGGRFVDFVFVKVGDLVEHGFEGAGLFADRDHLDNHRREDVGPLERLGDRLAFFNALASGHDRIFDDRVARGACGDLEAVEDRDADDTSVPSVRQKRATAIFFSTFPRTGSLRSRRSRTRRPW
jgi:hypothetical protein